MAIKKTPPARQARHSRWTTGMAGKAAFIKRFANDGDSDVSDFISTVTHNYLWFIPVDELPDGWGVQRVENGARADCKRDIIKQMGSNIYDVGRRHYQIRGLGNVDYQHRARIIATQPIKQEYWLEMSFKDWDYTYYLNIPITTSPSQEPEDARERTRIVYLVIKDLLAFRVGHLTKYKSEVYDEDGNIKSEYQKAEVEFLIAQALPSWKRCGDKNFILGEGGTE